MAVDPSHPFRCTFEDECVCASRKPKRWELSSAHGYSQVSARLYSCRLRMMSFVSYHWWDYRKTLRHFSAATALWIALLPHHPRQRDFPAGRVSPDLLKAIEGELKKRPKAKVISLHVEEGKHTDLLDLLYANLDFPKEDIIFVDGNLDLSSLLELSAQVVRRN